MQLKKLICLQEFSCGSATLQLSILLSPIKVLNLCQLSLSFEQMGLPHNAGKSMPLYLTGRKTATTVTSDKQKSDFREMSIGVAQESNMSR